MLVFETGDPKKDFLLQVFKFAESFNEPTDKFLSVEELQYVSEITNEKRHTEYLQSRFALKTLLTKYTGIASSAIEFKKVGEGKPVLKNPSIHLDFNLSHSHDYFAIALSEKGQVGVDVEKIRSPKNLASIAERFFSPAETQLINDEKQTDIQTEIFSKFWSGKEALVKAVGGGVFKNVHEVLIDETNWKIKRLPLEFGSLADWSLQFFDSIPGYACSVALKAEKIKDSI